MAMVNSPSGASRCGQYGSGSPPPPSPPPSPPPPASPWVAPSDFASSPPVGAVCWEACYRRADPEVAYYLTALNEVPTSS